MLAQRCILLPVIILCLGSSVDCGVWFSSLQRTLVVTAHIQTHADIRKHTLLEGVPIFPGVAKVGDRILVEWSLNTSLAAGVDDNKYVNVELKLCFAPVSQIDRPWRKTTDDLNQDKTCTASIVTLPFRAAGDITLWPIPTSTPGATYFVRAFAIDEMGNQLAYGQTTDEAKTTNLFVIEPISGRNINLDIASLFFCVLSVFATAIYLVVETRQAKTEEVGQVGSSQYSRVSASPQQNSENVT